MAQCLLSDIPILLREADDVKQWMWAPSSHCEVWRWTSSAHTDFLKDKTCLKIRSQMPTRNKKGCIYLNQCLKYWRESLALSVASWHYLEIWSILKPLWFLHEYIALDILMVSLGSAVLSLGTFLSLGLLVHHLTETRSVGDDVKLIHLVFKISGFLCPSPLSHWRQSR